GASAEALVGHDAELKARPLRGNRDEKHHGRGQAQVWRPPNLVERFAERMAMPFPAPRKAATADFRVCDRNNDGGGENQRGKDEEKIDRVANRAHEDASEQSAENCAERSPRADDAEQPLRLPRVELRVRKATGLNRRNDPDTVT